MALFAVTYRYADDTARLDEHRPRHRAFLRGLHEQGRLRLSGPTENGAALIVMEADTAEAVEADLDQDPFKLEGLIAERTVQPWTIVIGSLDGQ
ncbi:YciI family protein [Tersicoccus sp. MR15.9]|uniref:YciI family protein n=1 Tax=Tersicoccus mangrovi TaxID=3121635 RepID=UPI002FE5F764